MDIIYLLLSGLFEICMVFSLKKSKGFKKKQWSILTIVLAALSLLSLSLAMKTLEAGVAYSIWVAFGSIGSLLMGSIFFKEQISHKQLIFIVLIICSVIGLKIFS